MPPGCRPYFDLKISMYRECFFYGPDIGTLSSIQVIGVSAFILLLMICELFTEDKAHPLVNLPTNRPLRWCIYLLLVLSLLVFPGKSEIFIYFQF